MQKQKMKKLYNVTIYYPNQTFRTVKVKAVSLEVAERRALKRNPGALGVKRDNQ